MSRSSRKDWRSVARAGAAVAAMLLAFVILCAAIGTAAVVTTYGRNLPSIDRLSDIEPAATTRIIARDGVVLARLYDKDRVYVSITDIPPVMRQAIVATEDERFYQHHGVDIRGIVRAALANYHHERITQGASTITQQLARNLFLTNEQTIGRKIEEAMLAMQIERYYTKDEILERYLNLIYFGAGAYGVQAASHAYFGKDVARLTLPEAAMLAGLVAAPSAYSPYADLAAAKERQVHVLDRMEAGGFITRAQAAAAAQARLRFIGVRSAGVEAYRYPYFTTYVIAELEKTYSDDQLLHGGLTIYTSLDPALEDMAQKTVKSGVAAGLAEGYGMHQGALVAEDPRNGEIEAMIGGVGFSAKSQFNRAWQARRQPGSSFKGFVYSAAVDRGVPVSSIFGDTPITLTAGDGTDYKPTDDDHRFLGNITLRRAFALSRNVVAVKLAQAIGIDTVIDYAHKMGITEDLQPDLSLALGTAVVSPLDMVSGYSTIADGGVYTPPTGIRYVADKYGSIILDNRYPQRRVALSSGTSFIMTTMMESVIQAGTGYPNAIIGRPAAGKTGTTSDFRDAWFVGFVPQLSAAVWVGNDDYSKMYESYGGNVPARIWAAFMKSALAKVKAQDFASQPPDVQAVRICAGQNRRALPGQGGESEYFLNGTAPLAYCAPASPVKSKGAQVIGPQDDVNAQPAWQPTPTPGPNSTQRPTPTPQAPETPAASTPPALPTATP
jgi:penicillin-binding protein 1A